MEIVDVVRLIEIENLILASLTRMPLQTAGALTGCLLNEIEVTRPEVIETLKRLAQKGIVRERYANNWEKIT